MRALNFINKWLLLFSLFITIGSYETFGQKNLIQLVTDDINMATNREFQNSKGGADNNKLLNVSTPTRYGNAAFMHYVNKKGERSELAMDRTKIGEVYWYGWSMQFPKDFDHTESYTIVMQLASYQVLRNGKFPCGANGPYMTIEASGKLIFKNQHPGESNDMECDLYEILPDISIWKGKWLDFVMNAKWTGNKDGFLKLWVKADDNNYIQKINYKGPTWWNNEDKGPYFKIGEYMGDTGWKGPEERTLFTDEFRMGNSNSSFNEVAPPGAEARQSEAKNGKIQYLIYYSGLNKQDIVVMVYTPPAYNNGNDRYPTVYNLHGAGGGSPARQWDRVYKVLTETMENQQVRPMIYVFVNGLGDTFYANSLSDSLQIEKSVVSELIPFIDSRFRTIPSKEGRAVDGFSMGGFGALMLAFKHPDLFSSVVSYGAALIPFEKAIIRPNCLFSNIDHFNEFNPSSLIIKNADEIRKGVAIRMICGDQDGLLPNNIGLKKILDSLNIQVDWVRVTGVGHDTKGLFQRTGAESLMFMEKHFKP